MREIKTYFTFSRAQQRGILTLLTLLFSLTILWFYLTRWVQPEVHVPGSDLQKLMDAIVMDTEQSNNAHHERYAEAPSTLTPFPFDPNSLDEAGFKKLGLRDKLVKTLLNYRNKGGKFYNKQSLQRIYGLHEAEYRQLQPFIQLPDKEAGHSEWQKKEIRVIEINSADTSQWIALPGIGSKLAANIVAYRGKLGGFSTIAQLREVYGISEERLDGIRTYLRVDKTGIKKLNLNAATFYELNAHPYLRGALADSIMALRRRHAYKLDEIGQLREIALINEKIFRKIAPYLQTD